MKISILLLLPLLIFGLINCSKHNSDISSQYITNLKKGDSLDLAAYYSDCGEWGGHTEHIYLYYKNDKLLFTYKKDSIKCEGPQPEQNKLIEISTELTNEKTTIITKYIDSLIKFQNTHTELTSNGPNYYSIKTKDTFLLAYDEQWDFFQKTITELRK